MVFEEILAHGDILYPPDLLPCLYLNDTVNE
jgi:hypothetical protein